MKARVMSTKGSTKVIGDYCKRGRRDGIKMQPCCPIEHWSKKVRIYKQLVLVRLF